MRAQHMLLTAACSWWLLVGGCANRTPRVPDGIAQMQGGPGTLLQREASSGAPDGAAAYRVLYRSVGLDDRPIVVSGLVIVPAGPAPPRKTTGPASISEWACWRTRWQVSSGRLALSSP